VAAPGGVEVLGPTAKGRLAEFAAALDPGMGPRAGGSVSRPALWIEFPFEGEPRAILDCLNEGEEVRLLDWLRSRREERMAVALACFDWYAERLYPGRGTS
jgi:hypothetical protein